MGMRQPTQVPGIKGKTAVRKADNSNRKHLNLTLGWKKSLTKVKEMQGQKINEMKNTTLRKEYFKTGCPTHQMEEWM